MLISTTTEKSDDTQAVVIVKTEYYVDGVFGPHPLNSTYLVTLDKITNCVAVQCEGNTRRTMVKFDPTDRFDIEEKAAMCVLHFPRGAT